MYVRSVSDSIERASGHRVLTEASRFFMNDTEERTERSTPRVPTTDCFYDDEEPPGKPRRHPLWRNVPKKQWDDWRWQSQNAIRSVRQLRELLPFAPEELEAIGE